MTLPVTLNGRVLGWKDPSTRGLSHLGLGVFTPVEGVPSSVILGGIPPVYDQGGVGSCVHNALAGAVETLRNHQGLPECRPDRMELYYRTRVAEGTVAVDSGSLIADGVSALRSGYRKESRYVSNWGPDWIADPGPNPVDAPRVVNADPLAINSGEIQFSLACGFPVVVGLKITQAWEALAGDYIPFPGGDSIGGHAVCLVGYRQDDNGLIFRVRNSWSEAWGDRGYAWMPSEWVSLSICGEAYAIRAVRDAVS